MNPIPNIQEFQLRRERLMATIGHDAIAIVPANREVPRNHDVDYQFRQDSDFYYLTGFEEPDALLVLAPGHGDGDTALFVRPRDKQSEQWHGRRLGKERVSENLGISKGFNIEELDSTIVRYLAGRNVIHFAFGQRPEYDTRIFGWLNAMQSSRLASPAHFTLIRETLHELRLNKSEVELEEMQLAADISARAHIRAMQFTRPGISEHRVETEMLAEFYSHGARHTAYPSIVASGENACIMHYVDNNSVLQDSDLLLIDAGCEINHYAADITRTFPVNGKYSGPQRALYEVVLEAQLAAINAVEPGAEFLKPQEVSQTLLAQGLIDLGILSGSVDEVRENGKLQQLLVHRCSHFLGLDVHDVGAMVQDGKVRTLESGMVLTIEPGVYVSPELCENGIDAKWSGIGIRIEDDVVVTEEGRRALTGLVPKNTVEIEELMRG